MHLREFVQIVGDEPVFETGLLLAGDIDAASVQRQLSRSVAAVRVATRRVAPVRSATRKAGIALVHDVTRQGWSRRAIVRQLGIARQTERKWQKLDSPTDAPANVTAVWNSPKPPGADGQPGRQSFPAEPMPSTGPTALSSASPSLRQ